MGWLALARTPGWKLLSVPDVTVVARVLLPFMLFLASMAAVVMALAQANLPQHSNYHRLRPYLLAGVNLLVAVAAWHWIRQPFAKVTFADQSSQKPAEPQHIENKSVVGEWATRPKVPLRSAKPFPPFISTVSDSGEDGLPVETSFTSPPNPSPQGAASGSSNVR